jgi:hypothetical protein
MITIFHNTSVKQYDVEADQSSATLSLFFEYLYMTI